jgi:hypothetical protein
MLVPAGPAQAARHGGLTMCGIAGAIDPMVGRAAARAGLLNDVPTLGGHIRNSDFTQQTSFTARSIGQLAAGTGALRRHIVTQKLTFAARKGPA